MAKRVNTEGMRYPSVDKLLDKVDSKYKLAILQLSVQRLSKKRIIVQQRIQFVQSLLVKHLRKFLRTRFIVILKNKRLCAYFF